MIVRNRVLGLLAVLLMLAMTQVTHASSYKDALLRFSLDSYADTEAAIAGVAESGQPGAEAIVEALRGGALYVVRDKVAIRDGLGIFRDAVTGEALPAAVTGLLKPVRVNNRVRRAIDAALGSLTLLNADPRKRREAAKAVFRSRDASALPALDRALAQEADDEIKASMVEARAAIILSQSDSKPAERLSAVATLRGLGNQNALALLANMPGGASPELVEAARVASESIAANLALWNVVQNVWYGISLGSVLLLAAIGLAITFGTMGVINMAHGEMVMIGAYTTFWVQEIIRTQVPNLFGTSLLIALPLAFVMAGAIGIAIERVIIRFLYGRPLETLLATWGLSLMLQQAVRTIFGPSNREVGTPDWMSGALQLGGLSLTYNRIVIVIFAFAVFATLLLVMRCTSLGLYMRAVTQNRRMAGSVGIRTNRIDALAFGLGSGVAGIAGVALSQIDNVSPNLVVFGGVGNLWGTLVGAMTLGIANKLLEPYAGAVLGKILLLVAIILFIQRRPRGLFALRGRAAEA
jgi:urea transport system permease protein